MNGICVWTAKVKQFWSLIKGNNDLFARYLLIQCKAVCASVSEIWSILTRKYCCNDVLQHNLKKNNSEQLPTSPHPCCMIGCGKPGDKILLLQRNQQKKGILSHSTVPY